MTTISPRNRLTQMELALEEMELRIARATEQLERKVRMVAHGTTVRIRPLKLKDLPKKRSLIERLQEILSTRPTTTIELARALQVDASEVQSCLQSLKDAGRLWNNGNEMMPRWFVIVGDEVSPKQLYAAVEALVRDRPMTHQELKNATGARGNRISGAFVQLARDGKHAKNIGDARRARWFLQGGKE